MPAVGMGRDLLCRMRSVNAEIRSHRNSSTLDLTLCSRERFCRMSDEEANRKVSLTIQIPNYALKHLEAMAARMGLSVESLAAGEIHHAIDSDRSWYKATEIEWQSGQWISRHLFPPPQYYFSAGIFEQGETLYE